MADESFTLYDDDQKSKKQRGGIKSFTFTSTGRNGESHRKNKEKKHRQYLKNKQIRADLYASKGTMSAEAWHSQLTALSLGTA